MKETELGGSREGAPSPSPPPFSAHCFLDLLLLLTHGHHQLTWPQAAGCQRQLEHVAGPCRGRWAQGAWAGLLAVLGKEPPSMWLRGVLSPSDQWCCFPVSSQHLPLWLHLLSSLFEVRFPTYASPSKTSQPQPGPRLSAPLLSPTLGFSGSWLPAPAPGFLGLLAGLPHPGSCLHLACFSAGVLPGRHVGTARGATGRANQQEPDPVPGGLQGLPGPAALQEEKGAAPGASPGPLPSLPGRAEFPGWVGGSRAHGGAGGWSGGCGGEDVGTSGSHHALGQAGVWAVPWCQRECWCARC